RRHYSPHDAVVVRNARGEDVERPVSSGARLEPGLVVYRFGVGLFYANASRFTEEVMALVDVPEPPRSFVLQADGVDGVDFTGGETLVEAAQQLASRGIVFAVADPQEGVRHELDKFGLTAAIGSDHIYGSLEEAVAAFRAAPQTPPDGSGPAS